MARRGVAVEAVVARAAEQQVVAAARAKGESTRVSQKDVVARAPEQHVVASDLVAEQIAWRTDWDRRCRSAGSIRRVHRRTTGHPPVRLR